jgi:hypothetical protein
MLLIRHRSFALRPSTEICHFRSHLHRGYSSPPTSPSCPSWPEAGYDRQAPRRDGSALSGSSAPAPQPFEEVLHRNFERKRKLIQRAGGYAIDGPFVFLKQLERNAERVGKHDLGHSHFQPPQAQPRSNVPIQGWRACRRTSTQIGATGTLGRRRAHGCSGPCPASQVRRHDDQRFAASVGGKYDPALTQPSPLMCLVAVNGCPGSALREMARIALSESAGASMQAAGSTDGAA